MAKKLLLHIGTSKTGTSSIQSAMKILDNSNITYPILNPAGNQNVDVIFKNYGQAGRGVKSKYDDHQYNKFKADIDRKLKEAILASQCVVISSEFLFGFNKEQIIKISKYFKEKSFSEIKIVLYIRNPSSYYLSLIQQKLKASYVFHDPKSFKMNIKAKLENWVEVFGQENIIVREFNPKILVNGDAVSDFSYIMGAFFDENLKLDSIRVNESISAEGMKLMQDYRREHYYSQDDIFFKDSSKLVNKLIALYKSGCGSKPELKDSVYSLVLKNHEEDVEYLSSYYNIFEYESDLIKEDRGINEDKSNYSDLNDVLKNDLSPHVIYNYSLNLLKLLLNPPNSSRRR